MRDKIYVLSHGNKWKMQCDDCDDNQIVDTQAEAIRIARRHVASKPAGTLSQILVQRDDGQWRTEWTYGKDPFPPAG